MRKWFDEITTVEELRKQYRELLKKYHPGNKGGSVEATQEINTEYDAVFADLSNQNKSGDTFYTYEENKRFKAILNEIVGFHMTIEIIGSWIWCFDCFVYKDRLKALGFKYAPKKKAWTWHDGEYRQHGKEMPLSHIRAKYGSQTVRNQSHPYSLD